MYLSHLDEEAHKSLKAVAQTCGDSVAQELSADMAKVAEALAEARTHRCQRPEQEINSLVLQWFAGAGR